MNKYLKKLKKESSFTLIELVIVIGILAILAAVILLVLNPSQFFKETRDSQRITELQELNKALGLYQADGGSNLGTASTVYISIPDTSATCSNLGLPTLPSGWFYSCKTEENYQKTDGTGWVPVNLASISFGTPLNILPKDPVNATSTGNYYTYVMGGSWELNAIFESSRYRNDTSIVKTNLPGVYATGSNLTLSPITNNTGLVGYWKFDEGSGTTAGDSSGNGHTATLSGSNWADGKIDKALNNAYATISDSALLEGMSAITIAAWVYPTALIGTDRHIVDKGDWDDSDMSYRLMYQTDWNSGPGYPKGRWRFHIKTSTGVYSADEDNSYSDEKDNMWHYIVGTHDASTGEIRVYNNGVLIKEEASAGNINTNSFSIRIWKGTTGIADDVRIYNRALSEAEIQAIYNATK